MRKNILILLIFLSIHGFAQKSNVNTAAENLRKYNDLPKAKEAIDAAALNPATENDPKMWLYRGLIYLSIYQDKNISKNYPEAVSIAATSFVNCLKTDKGHDVINFTDSCNRYLWITGIGLYNKGYEAFKANDLATASKFFTQIFDVIPYDKENNLKRNNITADIVTKNLYLTARKANDVEKEKMYLQKLINAKFNEPMIYVYMSNVYLEQKDTAKALSYIEIGKKLYEENMSLMEEEARIYILQGRVDDLVSKLTENIGTNPENEVLYEKRGRVYQNKNNMEKAEADFKKAIELKPDFIDANFDLGILYFNQAADLIKAANEAKTNDESAKAKEKFEKKFKDAQPYLEKAKELNANKTEYEMSLYKSTLQSLKQLYARTNQTDKYNEVKAELEKK